MGGKGIHVFACSFSFLLYFKVQVLDLVTEYFVGLVHTAEIKNQNNWFEKERNKNKTKI